MCHDSSPEDFIRSRPRFYDLPALLLFHRPLRCRLCQERYYAVRTRRGKGTGPLPRLWMHYAIVATILIAVAAVCVTLHPELIRRPNANVAESANGKDV